MERMLEKMARRLNQYDEASLNALWERYYRIVQDQEPSVAWEEAVLILSMIQSVRWKNQLFNYHMTVKTQQGSAPALPQLQEVVDRLGSLGESERNIGGKECKVLSFRTRKSDEPG